MANRRSIVSLQQIPIEILSKVLQKAEKNSVAYYFNLRKTCRIMNETGKSPEVLRYLSLSTLVKNPLSAYEHMDFLNICLENHKCAAYFVQGILSYFQECDVERGLLYFNNAAIGEVEEEILEAAYLWGVQRFLHDDPLEGPFEEVAFRDWQEDEEDLVARVWKNLRRILHGINVEKKPVYMQTLWNRRPPASCHLLDMEIDYPDCFMYKPCLKFFYMNQYVPYLQ